MRRRDVVAGPAPPAGQDWNGATINNALRLPPNVAAGITQDCLAGAFSSKLLMRVNRDIKPLVRLRPLKVAGKLGELCLAHLVLV